MQEEVRNCGCAPVPPCQNQCGGRNGFLGGLFGGNGCGCDSEILFFIIIFLLLFTNFGCCNNGRSCC